MWHELYVSFDGLCWVREEYDSYAPTICRWLRQGVDEHKLAAHLSQVARVSMGVSRVDEELHGRVAKRLLELVS